MQLEDCFDKEAIACMQAPVDCNMSCYLQYSGSGEKEQAIPKHWEMGTSNSKVLETNMPSLHSLLIKFFLMHFSLVSRIQPRDTPEFCLEGRRKQNGFLSKQIKAKIMSNRKYHIRTLCLRSIISLKR